MYSIVNGWDGIRFMCCKNHKEPKEMKILTTPKAVFYACPNYFPENRGKDEPACVNSIFLNDAEKAVAEIHDRIGKAAMQDREINLANAKFSINNVDYTVLRDENGQMDIAVENRKVVRS